MKPNPRFSANLFSLLTFGYTIPLFKQGLKKELYEDDMYSIVKRCDSKRCGEKSDMEWRKSHSMLKLLWNRFACWYTILFLFMIVWTEIHSVLQPYAMSRLISYFEKNQTAISRQQAVTCGGIVMFVNIFHYAYWKNVRILEIYFAIELSTSLKSLLYYKVLRMSNLSLSTTGVGNIVTIITKDISCIEFNLFVIMDTIVWIAQVITSSYLLWAKIGYSSFVGIGILLVILPLQYYLSTLLTKLKLKIGKNSDDRLQVTQEALSAIRIVKMYTWEEFFISKINQARKKEIINLIRLLFVRFLVVSIGSLASKLTFLVLIVFYLKMGYKPDTETIFYILNIFQTLSASLSWNLPVNFNSAAQIRAAFERLNRVLRAEEIKREDNIDSGGEAFVKVQNASVKMQEKNVLKNVSLELTKPGLAVITGAVGSGKSSLFKLVLQDLPISTGTIKVNGLISYASQEPWLFPATIKENILFGEPFEFVRYHQVVQVCDLEYDLSLLEKGDDTLVADRGQNLSKGQQARINLARAVYRKSDIYLLDDSLAALDGHVQDYIFNECILKFLEEKICVLVSQKPEHIERANVVVVLRNGNIFEKVNSSSDDDYKGIKKTYIALEDNVEDGAVVNCVEKINNVNHVENKREDKVYKEEKKPGKVDLEVYKKYFRYGGGMPIFIAILILYIISQFFESYSDKLLSVWIDKRQEDNIKENSTFLNTTPQNTTKPSDYVFNMYTIFVIFQSIFNLVKYYVFLLFCRNASINIHKIMSANVVKAVMAFFDKHYIGNILNRFSYDLNNIDESLPFGFPNLFRVIFSCVGSIILIATVNWHLLIPLIVVLISLLIMRYVFIPTGRNLKRLEAATRSPMIGHINSTVEGLTTIRAFKAEELLKRGFDKHQDVYNSAIFTEAVIYTAFEFFLETLSASMSTMIVIRFLFFEHDTSVGDVGLALTQVFNLNYAIESGVRQWAELETNMTSVERVLEYVDVTQEKIIGSQPKNWPREGSIKFDKVKVSYSNSKEAILKNICFRVKPKNKIGIVGRTGAGKSSIISALFRLYEFEGVVEIDGTSIKTIALNFLRSNIGIIPQDPILFTGTIRENIDPYHSFPDEKIWQAIERAKVRDIIPTLDTKVQENGSAYSTGQKQLICLARAAIGNRKVVVLDEATANLDKETEDMLYGLVEELFSDCTILIVAHRLEYIKKCDMVMVIDSGTLVEFDEPEKLLGNEQSVFARMCREAMRSGERI